MKLLAALAVLVCAALGTWWMLAHDESQGRTDALQPEEGASTGTAPMILAPDRLESRVVDPVAQAEADAALEAAAAELEDRAPRAPLPDYAARYDGWKGQRMLAESRRMLAQLDLAARAAARPLLTGSAAEDDVGSLPLTSGILVREKGRRMVLDEQRFADLYALRAQAVWVAQEGGRRVAAEND